MALGPNEPITHAKMLQERIEALEAGGGGGGNGGITPLIIDAKGDIIVGTAADIPDILPVGSDGQILSADSTTETGLKWITISGGGDGSTAWADITGKPSTFPPSTHNHAQSEVTGLTTALSGKASTSHTHPVSDVTNLSTLLGEKADAADVETISTALDLKADADDVTTALAAKADLVAGKVPSSQLPDAAASAGVQVWEWYVDTAVAGAGVMRRYNDSGQTLTIIAVRVRANLNAPTGADLVVDLNKNGVTVFTTQANRPRVLNGTQDSGKVTNMNVTTVEDGAYIVPDIDAVGSTVPGSGVLVSVTLR